MELAHQQDKKALEDQLEHAQTEYECSFEQMPWSLIDAELMSKISDTLSTLDFSKKSLKSWLQHFQELFDHRFVTKRVAKLAVIYNSCSPSLKNRLLPVDIGSKARNDEYMYKSLLRTIGILCMCTNHTESALQSLIAGVMQNLSDSVPVYLEKMRELGEDAYESSFLPHHQDCHRPQGKKSLLINLQLRCSFIL